MAKKKMLVVGPVGLQKIVEATLAGTILNTLPAIHEPLIATGLVEINPAIVTDAGEIATRATQAGIDLVNKDLDEAEAAPAAPAAPYVKRSFLIEDVPLSLKKARTGRETIYPFDALNIGQSFFVANTPEHPDVAKSLASTVSSANQRFSVPATDGSTRVNKKGETVPAMVKTRTFGIEKVEGGARVGRTA